MLVSYAWLKEYLGDAAPTPEETAELLTFHAFEIEGVEAAGEDTVIEVDVLPNRSSDCLCHRGIAREVATLTGQPLAHDPLATPPELAATDAISVDIEDEVACPRFTAALITGVAVKESPAWLKERLQAIGQRPINNIVDATNYVMFALGQPLHAYDAELFPQVNGQWQFAVRKAKAGEVVSLIAEGGKDEDRDVELSGSELLIVDKSSSTPIGLAGVKGGRFAGVHKGTTKVIIEAAHFNPNLTRQTARRLGIVIDASKRFENEPSRELPPYAQQEIIRLITDIAGGTFEGMADVYPLPQQSVVAVEVSSERVNALLGLSLPKSEMVAILERVGCVVEDKGDVLTATGPFERTDLTIEEDFIEEIGRVYGYEHVASVVPEPVPLAEINTRHYYSEQVRHFLIERGFSEVITSSFRKKDQIHLKNALASDKEYLRSSLIKNITETLDKNANLTDLLGTEDTRIFEIGTVFETVEGDVSEHTALTIGVRMRPSGYSGKEDKLLQAILIELEQTLGIPFKWNIQKGVAECNFSNVIETLPQPTAYEAGEKSVDVQYQPFSLYPHMSRDIAMWTTEGTTAEEIEQVLNEHAGELRVRNTLFDEFTKDGRTSYAFRLVFQASDRTLTDEEVNTVMDDIYKAVAEKGWEVR
jgi:phenylalanyl-tRNA synthetase beta chain